ncbi:MAG: hypothetical protein ICV75_04730 [Nitrospiraceae bacterium]|nr:hypothetical protein [Nitrospiraceae bacterium]
MSMMSSVFASRRRLLPAVAMGLILLLLVMAPFAVALEIHHALAAADHDGHEHSATDLCQWVQHHTSGSIDVATPSLSAGGLVRPHAPPVQSVLLSVGLSFVGPSRAPPAL